MSTDSADALSPLDGRYARKLVQVRQLFSEAGLMRERVRVECAWVLALAAGPGAAALSTLPRAAQDWLTHFTSDPSDADVPTIKAIEARTNHDVKGSRVLDPWRTQSSWCVRGARGVGALRLHLGGHQ